MAARPSVPGTFLVVMGGPEMGSVWQLLLSARGALAAQGTGPVVSGLPSPSGVADSGSLVCVSLGAASVTGQGSLACYASSTFAPVTVVDSGPAGLGPYPGALLFTLDGLMLVVAHGGTLSSEDESGSGGVVVYLARDLQPVGPSLGVPPAPVFLWTSTQFPLLVGPRAIVEYDGGLIVTTAGGTSAVSVSSTVLPGALKLRFEAPYLVAPRGAIPLSVLSGSSQPFCMTSLAMARGGVVFTTGPSSVDVHVFAYAPVCLNGFAMSATRAGVCDLCPPGTATSKTDREVCQPCAPGTYATGSGTSRCAACEAGR
jgi:hypothetical protein